MPTMNESSLMRLNLRAPLEYDKISPPAAVLDPGFWGRRLADNPQEEALFCFEINREQGERIDPDPEHFLGKLVFSGTAVSCQKDQLGAAPANTGVSLPAGLYLFIQERRVLEHGDCINAAIEQQKDGLWERLSLENRLYIRCLFEDSCPVTQLFRPFSNP